MQAFVSLNWVLSEEPLDLETELALDFLDYLLVRSRRNRYFHASCVDSSPTISSSSARC